MSLPGRPKGEYRSAQREGTPVSLPSPTDTASDASTWAPLRQPVFRMLWGVWMMANVCMWMNDVAAAWLMTSLTTSPVMVALVQSASTLPVLLLGLPSGALADILDRRRYFMATQFWVASVAVITCAVIVLGDIKGYDDRLDHMIVFFNAIRTGSKIVEDASFGLRAAAPSIACNLSAERKAAVLWDPEKMVLKG